MDKKDYFEIDLLKIAKDLLRRIWIIILAAIVCGGAFFGFTYFFVEPKYEAKAMMYVNNSNVSVGGTDFFISASSLSAAQELVNTYIVVLKSRTTLREIIEQAGVNRSYGEVRSMITAAPVSSTEIFEIVVTSTDPIEAEKIANAITKVLPERIADIVEGSSVRIVDYAVVPTVRSSPSYSKNTLIGMLLGALISVLVIVLISIFDVYIRDESYLADTYDIPVLATIPNVYETGSSSYKTYGYERADKEKK